VAALAVAGVGGSAMACAGSQLDVSLIDSGASVLSPSTASSISWVDNDRVLFVGTDKEGAHVPLSDRVLKLWHVSTGQIENIESGVVRFVYANGSIVTSKQGEGRKSIIETRRFDTRETVQRIEVEGKPVYDLINARMSAYADSPGQAFGRRWKPLRDGDGFLDFGESGATGGRPTAEAIQHRDAENGVLATLDLPGDQVERVSYVDFRNEYFLYSTTARRETEDGRCIQPAHWFSPDGRGVRHTDIPIPCDLLLSSGLWVHPTRVGYVVVFTGGASSGGQSRTQGLHLAGGDLKGRVLEGFVEAVAVSPDGCKISAFQAPSIKAKRKHGSTLKAFDICSLEDVPPRPSLSSRSEPIRETAY